MNKDIKQFCEKYDLEIRNDSAHGQINGYEVNVFSKRGSPFVLQINFYASEQQRNNIKDEISEIKNLRTILTPYGVETRLTMDSIDNVIESIFQVIRGYGVFGLGYCPVTGIELNSDNIILCEIGLAKVTLCFEGKNLLHIETKEEKVSYDHSQKNYLRGFIGILIGTTVGSISYIIFSIFGIFSAWTSLIAMIFGTTLYKRFGGRPDKIMILMSSLTTFVVFITVFFLAQILSANALVSTSDLSIRGIAALRICFESDTKFLIEFFRDLMLTILFTIIGIVLEVVSLFRSIRRR